MVILALFQSDPWSSTLTRLVDLMDGVERGALDLAAAAVIMGVGWGIAALLSRLLKSLLRLVRFNDAVGGLMGTRSFKHEPASLAGWALYWTVLSGSGLLALEALGIPLGTSVGERLNDVIPRIVTSAILFAVGWLIALLVGAIARRFLESAEIRAARLQGQIVSAVLTGFAILLALEQLGFAAQFVMAIGIVGVAATGVALALAFGLGCRDLARDFVVEYLRSLDGGAPKRPE